MSDIAIPTTMLEVDQTTGFDLYVRQGDRFVLFRSKDYPIDEEAISHISEMGLDEVFVRQRDRELLNQFLSTRIKQVISDEKLTIERRTEILYEAGCSTVRRFADNVTGPNFRFIMEYGRLLEEFCTADIRATREVFRLAGLETHHYTQSIHVAAVAANLARQGGLFTDEEVHALVAACLVRDLGMGRLPLRIRGSQEKLKDGDFEIIKEHVRHTRNILEEAGVKEALVKQIVFQHHERADGSGYPNGLAGADINPLSMVCAISDCYGALLTRRSYREPMPMFDALKLMLQQQAGKFDDSWMKQLIALLSKK